MIENGNRLWIKHYNKKGTIVAQGIIKEGTNELLYTEVYDKNGEIRKKVFLNNEGFPILTKLYDKENNFVRDIKHKEPKLNKALRILEGRQKVKY